MMCCPLLIPAVQSQNPAERLPLTFHSYRLSERLSYSADHLFEYINGAAELYLSYGLTGMTGCKYSGEQLPEISVEIYEMTEARNAFGVYTQSRDREERMYGQGSQSYREAILFWKDRYFVVINTTKATPSSEEAIRFLAAEIDKSIPAEGAVPSIVALLPAQGLSQGEFLYFHHYVWLNAYFFIADFNILDINEQTDALLAKYGAPQARSYLLLVAYPDENAAEKAYRQFMQRYAPEAGDGKIMQLEDKTWFVGWRKGNRVGAVFNGPDRESAEQLYQAALNKM
jgi:hypothetical protein